MEPLAPPPLRRLLDWAFRQPSPVNMGVSLKTLVGPFTSPGQQPHNVLFAMNSCHLSPQSTTLLSSVQMYLCDA